MTMIHGTTFNPSDATPHTTLSNGNLSWVTSFQLGDAVRTYLSKTSGKWYWEASLQSELYFRTPYIGIMESGSLTAPGGGRVSYFIMHTYTSAYVGYSDNINFYTSSAISVSSGEMIAMVAVDFDSLKIWFGYNGTWYNSGNPAAGTGQTYTINSGTIYYAVAGALMTGIASPASTANFGASAFTYSVPSGFTAGFGSEKQYLAEPRQLEVAYANGTQWASFPRKLEIAYPNGTQWVSEPREIEVAYPL